MTKKKIATKKVKTLRTKKTSPRNDRRMEAVAMQSLLLGKDELLVYKDEEGEYHILCKEEYNPKKDYQVLFLTHEDI